ncbi:MAG: tetratricopeptide repeat protein [Candidatus Daviesbacteria bacterium]|nr:tetratricopeptide repeat protein [Candidatus Daviesbacteria bacterium]
MTVDSNKSLHQLAINAALSSNWLQAIDFNLEILAEEPKSVEALNRLGRAYFELGKLPESKESFDKSLAFDPYNQIAAKFIKRIETCKKKNPKAKSNNGTNHNCAQVDSDLFIEEPGKTKLVSLLKVAEPQKLSLLSPGALVSLIIKNKVIAITDQDEEYLGVLPDDLSRLLVRLINGGNKYQAIIKTAKINGLSILIRETYRSSRFKNQPSFLDNLNMAQTYSSDNIVIIDDEEDPGTESDEEERS